MEKCCTRCGMSKDLSQFQIRRASKDGLSASCKSCLSIYEKKRANAPHRIQARKDYQKTEQGKAAVKRGHLNFIKKYPEKRKAHILVDNYIRDGKLNRPNQCGNCDCKCKPHAHHNDYTKPLEVTWLCTACHVEWHRHNKPIYKPISA